MARSLFDILKEAFDTGGPDASKPKWFVRKIGKNTFGRYRWSTTKKEYVRKGAKYNDRTEAEYAAKITAL